MIAPHARKPQKRDVNAAHFERRCRALGFDHTPVDHAPGAHPVFASLDGALRVDGVLKPHRLGPRLHRRQTIAAMFKARQQAGNKKAAGVAAPTAPSDQTPSGE